ncbi:hypothetical protein [Leucobacter sp. M11]|uniref:hypothetical protein n=1 Tax=Leucobacter sp. M11 TaxID=2993565 RepID=UPI002D7F679F|nr:hypothetical protein [Leucobacter sp. M11]MEB4616678.1 hypothetical protein [Leucobacter sp. M11]
MTVRSRRSRRALPPTLAILLTLTLGVGGCARPDAPSVLDTDPAELTESEIEADLSAYESVTADLDFARAEARLPLDRAITEGVAEMRLREHQLRFAKLNACFAAQQLPPRTAISDSREFAEVFLFREFGFWDVSGAAVRGYDLPNAPAAGVADDGSAHDTMSEAERACWEAADEGTEREEQSENLSLATQLRDRAWYVTTQRAEVRAANDAAAACMREQGLTLDENQEVIPPEPDQEGILRTALTEARCRVDTGQIRVSFDTQARLEASYLDENEATLEQEITDRSDRLAELDRAIADVG